MKSRWVPKLLTVVCVVALVGCGKSKLSVRGTQGQGAAGTASDNNPLMNSPSPTPTPSPSESATPTPTPTPTGSPTPTPTTTTTPTPERPSATASEADILNYVYGEVPSATQITCATYLSAGYTTSRTYLVGPYGAPESTYCEQQLEGGGWSMVYNSVVSTDGQQFFNIPYADRLGRKGTPALQSNFYDGEMNTRGTRFLDVVEDKNGTIRVLLVATTTGINTDTMTFQSPAFVSGNRSVYNNQFAGGWASPDHDSDNWIGNCASYYGSVTQNYGNCWYYNLGADADAANDGVKGPHVYVSVLTSLGLATDGSYYSGVRRITRYVKW